MKKNKLWALVLLVGLVVALPACNLVGTVTPPGKTVILLHPDGTSEIITDGVFKAYGRTRAYFVDQKLSSFKESMKILCTDDINMDVDVKWVGAFDVDAKSIDFIKDKVPAQKVTDGDLAGWELSLDRFYKLTVSDIVRSTTRNIVSEYKTDDIRPNRVKIEADIGAAVRDRLGTLKYPLVTSAVLMSNIDYPQTVKNMRNAIKKAQLEDQRKAALADAELAEAKRRVAVEQEQAKVRLVRAEASAEEIRRVAKTLTPEYLMFRQLETLLDVSTKVAAGPNNTVFMMPFAAMNQDMLSAALVREAVAAHP